MDKVSLLCCAMSLHLTDMYEPAEGYNETHESLGVHYERQVGDNNYGLHSMYFRDSFNKDSGILAVTYTRDVGTTIVVDHAVGAGIGIVKTSYYTGPLPLPIYEVKYEDIGVQFSVFPPAFGSEALLMGQMKMKLYEVE